jgi:hypothetical protein
MAWGFECLSLKRPSPHAMQSLLTSTPRSARQKLDAHCDLHAATSPWFDGPRMHLLQWVVQPFTRRGNRACTPAATWPGHRGLGAGPQQGAGIEAACCLSAIQVLL